MLMGIDDALSAVRGHLNDDLPLYSEALEGALKSVNPVFTRPEYAEFFWNCAKSTPGWIQTIFVQSAVAESIGSRNIFSYWQSVHGNKEVEDGLLWHAKDEARHSRIFLTLVDLTFPGFIPEQDRRDIEDSLYVVPRNHLQKVERKLPEPILLNYLATVNIAEIRTLINLHLLAPIFYTFAPADQKDKVMRLLQSLQKDEIKHISYTAKIINESAHESGKQFIGSMYRKNLQEFGDYSSRGLQEAIKMYGGGEFFDLLPI